MPRANGITRQEILTCLKTNGALTADDLSKELGISQVAVRQHIASLEAEGVVTITVERKGLGRPSHRYLLTVAGDETFPRKYAEYAASLLSELQDWQGAKAVDELISRCQNRQSRELAPRLDSKSLLSRVQELARIENEKGFMTELVNSGDGAMSIVKRNCTICALAQKHPETCCQGKVALYKDVLGNVSVRQTTSIAHGDLKCSFEITAL